MQRGRERGREGGREREKYIESDRDSVHIYLFHDCTYQLRDALSIAVSRYAFAHLVGSFACDQLAHHTNSFLFVFFFFLPLCVGIFYHLLVPFCDFFSFGGRG